MFIRHKILPAVGLLGLIAAGGAQAAGLVSAGNAFHISGSTALDNQIKDALLLAPPTGPCTAGTIHIYTDAPFLGAGKGNITKAHQTTIVCNLAAAIGGLSSGTTVAFTKESNGGSNEGTAFIANQAPLAFFDATVAPVGCQDVGALAAGFYWAHQQAIADEQDACTGTVNSIIPEIGVADEDPSLFNVGLQQVSSAQIAKLNTTPLFQNQFAIAVSLNFYRALQRAQGLTLDDTLANMPSLTRAEIAALYNGTLTSWANILSPSGAAINSAAYTAGAVINPQVYLCRRGDNSGTNVSADVYFLHNRCSYSVVSGTLTPVGTPMLPVTSSTCVGLPAGQTAENNGCTWNAANIGDTVFGGAATGDVVSCLNAHSVANTTFAFGHLGATSKFDDPLGVEASGEPGTAHFRYIAISGSKPTVLGMANGTYDYAMDNVENLFTGLSGNALSVGNYLGTLFQNTTALSDILVAQPNAQNAAHVADANYITGGLVDGFNAGSLNTPPVTAAAVTSNPASVFTFFATGGVNNCQRVLPIGSVLPKEAL